ncbi:MAG: S8 family serine peptidase [Gemmatimonadaceae bacterium]
MKNSAPRPRRAFRAPAVRWASLLAVVAIITQVVACSEKLPVAPVDKQVANIPLPFAPSYIVQAGSGGQIPASVKAAIRNAGGRIVRVQPDMSLALVTGLTAAAANRLRTSGAVGMILPNVRRQYVHDPLVRTRTVKLGDRLAVRPSAARRVSALDINDPRTAEFFDSAQWNMKQVHADSAWQVTSQGAGAKVFILDTGVDTTHIDLVGRIDGTLSTSVVFAPNDTVDSVPLPFGHDVVGHGTFVSSLIASNSLGVAAVAPQAHLVMVRVLDDQGSADDFTVISGILYAADNGADVINLSLGGYLSRDDPFQLAVVDLIQRTVDYATARGALVVAAGGNSAVNTNTATGPTGGSYADSIQTPGGGIRQVVSVGATGPINQQNFDMIAQYSNFGKADIAVFAPGGNITDTIAEDLVLGACSSFTADQRLTACLGSDTTYVFEAGTSFAAPMVSAEAAVIIGQALSKPTPAQLEACLLNTADVLPGTSRPDINYNFGRIDVLAGATKSSCK